MTLTDPRSLVPERLRAMAAAVYVSQHTSRAVRLRVPVVDRVGIDTTFVTRDLVPSGLLDVGEAR